MREEIMATQQEKINSGDLSIGMYVSSLDRPWSETPFPIQGFHIRTAQDVERLRTYCKYVLVDRRLSRASVESVAAVATKTSRKVINLAPDVPMAKLPKFEPVEYGTPKPLKKEVAAASLFHAEISKAIIHVLNSVRKGKEVNLRVAKKAASLTVNSIIRNPDAFVWLSRLKDADSYSYSHSVRSSILAAVFGRHIGLPKNILEELTLGVLLAEVGKTRIPRSLLNKPSKLTDEEFTVMQKHVDYGVALLRKAGVSEQVLSIVQHHHERHDGSGYPHGLSGASIPMLARIAGIVDCYDAMTSPRPYAAAVPSTEAVSALYEQRDKKFQGELVEQFIQAIGIYPTGTLIQMSSKEVGIVITQNRSRRLRPVVMVVTDAQQNKLAKARIVDLVSVLKDQKNQDLSIQRCLPSGEYGIYVQDWQVGNA